ncbi:MAG: TIGR03364 family FAD-dependent oxidoreductase [Bacteroidetes bacterium]|nr:TIGR03364 family FAD-dependent oxidoreductase [Bacteroidota bacterium]
MKYDIAIVGGGIIGLAHAVFAVENGYSVLLTEKDEKAVGASIRNFGLIWPIGQPPGKRFERALRSRNTWAELSRKAGFWSLKNGSIHLAYEPDEYDIISEYHRRFGYKTTLLNEDEVQKMSPNVRPGVIAGLYSEPEMNVDPKEAIYSITEMVAKHPKCSVHFSEKALHAETGILTTTKKEYRCDQILICSGSDFQSLFPSEFASSPLIKSKLQMMRTQPQPKETRLGPTICGGLTLRHYDSFAGCESLDAYKDRISEEMPEYEKWGIHVMISQNSKNEWVIGDSHEYGFSFDPFNKKYVNDLILTYLNKFLLLEKSYMLETWYGVYAKNPEGTEFVAEPVDGVKIITGFGGAGMTFSFGFAEEMIDNL